MKKIMKKAQNGTTTFPERRTKQEIRDSERIMNASRPPKSKLDKNGLYPIGSKEEKARRGGDEFDFKTKSSSLPKKKMGGTMKKAKAGFDLNKDGKTTFKDVLIGRGVLPKTAKKGSSMKKAQMGTDMMQSPMMKKGGAMKKCKYGCK